MAAGPENLLIWAFFYWDNGPDTPQTATLNGKTTQNTFLARRDKFAVSINIGGSMGPIKNQLPTVDTVADNDRVFSVEIEDLCQTTL